MVKPPLVVKVGNCWYLNARRDLNLSKKEDHLMNKNNKQIVPKNDLFRWIFSCITPPTTESLPLPYFDLSGQLSAGGKVP